MLALFTFPAPTDLLTSITVWSSPTFDSYLFVAYFTIGVAVGAMIIVFLVRTVISAVQYLVERKDRQDEEIHPKYKIHNITARPTMTSYLTE